MNAFMNGTPENERSVYPKIVVVVDPSVNVPPFEIARSLTVVDFPVYEES